MARSATFNLGRDHLAVLAVLGSARYLTHLSPGKNWAKVPTDME